MKFILIFLCWIVISNNSLLNCQAPNPLVKVDTVFGTPIIFSGDTLFNIVSNLGPFTVEQRKQSIEKKLEALSKNIALIDTFELKIIPETERYDIYINMNLIFSVLYADTLGTGKTPETLSKEIADIIEAAIIKKAKTQSLITLLLRILYIVLITAILYILFKLIRRFYPKIYEKIDGLKGKYIKTIKIQKVELFNEEKLISLLYFVAKIFRIFIFLLLLYFYFPLIFGIFPETQIIADKLVDYILYPIIIVWDGIYNFLPNLFFIIVFIVLTYYAIKLTKLIFNEINKGNLSIPGFYEDWSIPTYKLVRFAIFAFAAIIIYPYLPGSDSDAFKGITIFLGLLISLGSSSAIANIIAGIVLIYMRSFSIGDRVKIADAMGDIVERTLLVTRIRTVKNVNISIPNAMILSSHIINYSKYAKNHKLILHTSVTIGYDVEHEIVKELLIKAAEISDDALVLPEPKPFVLITKLDDYYIHYELNVYTADSNKMSLIYSELHQNIVNEFNKAGVEIMSPAFTAARDGNRIQVPDEYIPKDYQQPPFKIFGVNLFGQNK